eukprot:scaffold59035_cov63-Phaeocystis_antarctica.AAC.1
MPKQSARANGGQQEGPENEDDAWHERQRTPHEGSARGLCSCSCSSHLCCFNDKKLAVAVGCRANQIATATGLHHRIEDNDGSFRTFRKDSDPDRLAG